MRFILKLSVSITMTSMDQPPIANAGADEIIMLPKDSVVYDGSASVDPDGIITSYNWVKISGPASSDIIEPDSSQTLIKTLVMGLYNFELMVTEMEVCLQRIRCRLL